MPINPVTGVIIGGSIIGGLSSSSAAKKAQNQANAIAQQELELAKKQDARSDELFQYYKQQYQPAETQFLAQTFGVADTGKIDNDIKSVQDQIANLEKEKQSLVTAQPERKITSTSSIGGRQQLQFGSGVPFDIILKNQARSKQIDTDIATLNNQLQTLNTQRSQVVQQAADASKRQQQQRQNQLDNFAQISAPDPRSQQRISQIDQDISRLERMTEPDPLVGELIQGARGDLSRLEQLAQDDPELAAELAQLKSLSGISERSRGYQGQLDTFPDVSRKYAEDVRALSSKPIDYYETDPRRYAMEVARAAAESDINSGLAEQARERELFSYGINPNSGRFTEEKRLSRLDAGLSRVGAINQALNTARDVDYNRRVGDYNRELEGLGIAYSGDIDAYNLIRSNLATNESLNTDEYNRLLSTISTRQGARDNEIGNAGNVLNARLGLASVKQGLTADQINKLLTLINARRGNLSTAEALKTDTINRAGNVINLGESLSTNDFNKSLQTLQLGRGLQANSVGLAGNAATGLNSATSAYNNIARTNSEDAAAWTRLGLNIADKAGLFDTKKAPA